jgi:RND family efflux transporter MFP subunit
MRRRIITGVIVVLVLVAGVRLVRLRKSQLMNQEISVAPALPVESGRVTRGDFNGELLCYGVVASDRQATLRARVGGTVSRILSREGEQVAAGAPLLELDGTAEAPRDARLAATTAVRNLQRSITGLERTRKNLKAILDNDRMLFENEAISAQQVELSENRYQEADVQLAALQSELAAQRTQLSLYTLHAPFSGTIAALTAQVGDVVPPFQLLARLESAAPCKVTATVAAADLARLEVGAAATLIHAGDHLRAAVGRVHPSLDASGTGRVDILLDEPPFALPLGASVEVHLAVDRLADVLLLPPKSLLAGSGRQARVHRIESDTVQVVPVEILAESGERVAVRGELASGDLLVRGSDSLLMRLANGTRVILPGAEQ